MEFTWPGYTTTYMRIWIEYQNIWAYIARERVNTANTKALKLVWWHCDTSLTAIHALSSQGFPNWSVGRFWDALADQLTWQGTYHVFQLWVSCFFKNPRYPSVGSLKGSQQNQVMSNPPLAVPATIVKPLLALPACRLSTHLQPILLLQPPVQVQNPD